MEEIITSNLTRKPVIVTRGLIFFRRNQKHTDKELMTLYVCVDCLDFLQNFFCSPFSWGLNCVWFYSVSSLLNTTYEYLYPYQVYWY